MITVELVSIDFDEEKCEAKIEANGQYNQLKNEVYSLMNYMRKHENSLYRQVMGRLLKDDMSELVNSINKDVGTDILKFTKED